MITPDTSSKRILLTYPNPGYTRICIYFSIALLAYGCVWLTQDDGPTRFPGLRAMTANHWWPAAIITTLLFSLFATILEGLFLIGQKFDPMKLEFDADNLYITVTSGERIVPLKEITSFRLIYRKRLVDNGRIPLYRYAIRFGHPGDPEEVQLTIFRRTGYTFADLLSLVKEKNPNVEIKNSANSWL